MKTKVTILLSAIFLLAFVLRILYLSRQALTFSYDQARDAYISQQITGGHLKILGPPASTPGLYHGVFYYYLLAPAYYFGHGSPIAAAYWMAFLNSLSILIVFSLTYRLTKKTTTSILASFLFAISFEATQYASWLSNPTIGIWTVPLIYLGLWVWLMKGGKKWGPVVTALGLGASIQGEIFLAYHIIPIAIWLWLARKKIERKSLFLFGTFLILALSSMILAEVKFGFRSFEGIKAIFGSQDTFVNRRSLGDFTLLYLNQFGRIFTNSILPSNAGYGGALGVAVVVWAIRDWWISRKREIISWQIFLATFIFAHLPIVSFGGISTPFLTVGLETPAIILSAIVLVKLWNKKRILATVLFIFIAFSNLSTIKSQNIKGQTLFAIQNDMTIKYEKLAIDYTYREAGRKPFSINSITSPLWINTVWSYLYNWYGKNTYGYLPQWHGRDQIGQLGNNLPQTSKDTKTYFLIIEPEDVPSQYLTWEIGSEDAKSTLIEEKRFGGVIIQKRYAK